MEFPVRIPFAELLGLELLHWQDGESHLVLQLRPELTNSLEVAHGGVVMTMLDVAMALAARVTPSGDPGEASPTSATIEMKTTFMRGARGRLEARGRVLHRTASLIFCESSLRDERGTLVAQASGTFKTVRGLPVDGRRPQRPEGPESPKDPESPAPSP